MSVYSLIIQKSMMTLSMTSSSPSSKFFSGKKLHETERQENICLMNSFLAYLACSTDLYLIKMYPNPFTLFLTYQRSISIGLGMITLPTSPCRFAISDTSYMISLYSSSMANYYTVTTCFKTTTFEGGYTSLSQIFGGYSKPPIASTFLRMVSMLPSEPNSERSCLWYSMYCLGLPSFSCCVRKELHIHKGRRH